MSDSDKKKKVEVDPIQDMLERLRRVVDTPVEKLDFSDEPKTVAAPKNSKKKAAEPKKAPASSKAEELPAEKPVEEVEEIITAEVVATPCVVEDAVTEEKTEERSEETDEDPEVDEDIDDSTLALFFAEEETPEAEEIAEAEEAPVEADEPPFVPVEESVPAIEENDGREYDLLTFDDLSFLDEGEEDRDNSWREGIAFPHRTDGVVHTEPAPITPDAFAFVHEEPLSQEEDPAPLEEPALARESVPAEEGEKDADWLFRPRASAFDFDFDIDPLPEEEAVPEPETVVANDENGYSVEVAVNSSEKAWYTPAQPEKDGEQELSFSSKVLMHEIEEDNASALENAAPLSEEKDTVTEPSFFVPAVDTAIETVDTDDADDLVIPILVQEHREQEGENSDTRSFSWEPVPPKKETEEKKKSFLSSFSSFFHGEGGSARSRAFGAQEDGEGPEALSGIYNEAGAEYHEYTSRNQIGLFSRRFVALVSSCTVRVIALAFLCTLLLLLEDLSFVGVTLGGFFARPGGMAGAHLLLMIFVVLCCIPMLSQAWRHLFNNRVLPEAYLAIGLICSILYDVILLLGSATAPHLFGLVPAVGALILSIVELLKTKGDFASFKLVSSSGDKLACAVSCGAQTKSEAVAVADLEEGTDTRILSVKKVGFAAGFFHRISRVCEDGRKNLWLLIMALVSSLATAALSGILIALHILPQNGFAALYAFCVTLSFSFPICSLLLHKLPAVQLFSRAAATRCAVVGEVSALEYCDAAAVAFEDVEAFPARNVRVQRIKLYGDAALDHVLYRVAGLFSVVGGPLDGVFRASTAEVGLSAKVRLLRAEEGGIVASVDGHEVCVGRGEYMLARNVHMYYDPDDEQNLLGGKVNIMYAAEDGHLIAKFYVRYKMDEDFERDVEELHKRGIRTVIRTYDPNITEALVAGISYTERFDVRIVRKTADQQNDFAADRLNSGIVCKTSCRDILRTLFACRRMCQVISVSERCNLLVACFGMLLSLILCAFGVVFSLPSVLLALYQLIWVGLITLGGKLYI